MSTRTHAGHWPHRLITRTAALLLALLMLPAFGDPPRHGQATRIFSTQGLDATFAYLSFARAPEHYPDDLLELREMRWGDANELCDFLARHDGTGWRLPKQAEFEALVADRAFPDHRWLSNKRFHTVGRSRFWLAGETAGDAFVHYVKFEDRVWLLDGVRKTPGVEKAWTVCVRGAYRGAAPANLPRASDEKPSTPSTITLTRQPDRAEQDKAAADAAARAQRDLDRMRAAEEQRVAKENAALQAKVLEREVHARQSCMKPENRGMCACLKYQATPPGGWQTCGK